MVCYNSGRNDVKIQEMARTDGRTDGRSVGGRSRVYQFSRMGRLLHFPPWYNRPEPRF